MPKGGIEDRMMHHIKASEMAHGKSAKEAESIAWAHIKHPKYTKKHKKRIYDRAIAEAMKRHHG